METPILDEEIDRLECYKKALDITKHGQEMLSEYKAIKEALSIHDVSHCPLCGSDDLFQYKLQHIHCQKCHESFNKGCD